MKVQRGREFEPNLSTLTASALAFDERDLCRHLRCIKTFWLHSFSLTSVSDFGSRVLCSQCGIIGSENIKHVCKYCKAATAAILSTM